MEYVGEVLDYRAFKCRTRRYARENHEHHYFMALSADEVIDAAKKGNLSRFINHWCDPNAETQKVYLLTHTWRSKNYRHSFCLKCIFFVSASTLLDG